MLVVAILLARPDPVAKADDRVCDALTGLVSRGTPSGLVTIVEIDEESLSQQGRWPWPRDVLGLLVRRILEGGAAAVALDMVLHEEDRGAPATLTGNGNGTNDEVLAGILAGKPVVLGYVFRFDGTSAACAVQPLPMVVSGPAESSRTGFFHAAGALCSVPRISRAAAGNGFLNAAPNADGRLRSLPLVIESGDQYYPSLALAAFQVYRRASSMQLGLGPREASSLRVGTRTVRLEGPSSVRLRFRGPRRTFPYLSAARLLSGRPSPGDLHGQIVIVGGSALGLPNSFASSVDPMLPAVEVQATAIDNLLQGDFFHRAAALHAWELLLALCAGVAATFLLVRVRSWWSPLIVLGLAGGTWAGCAVLLSRTGLLLSPLPVTAVLACAFPVVTLLNYRQEKSRAERTEEKLVESEKAGRAVLRESESRYRRLVENINDAIIIDDAEGRLVFANRRLREWFGFADRDIRTVAIGDYVAPEWRAEVRDRHRRRMNGEDVPQQYEYEGVRPDGSKIWIDALVTKIEEQGRIVGTQAALRDITERKRIEAQYLQAQKMESVGRLAGVVAHDFNNLLTVINGYADLLLKLPPGQAPQHAALQQIRKAGERAAELTRHLLLFSRKQTVQLQALDLNLVVSAEEEMFGRLIGENIRLSTRLSPTLGQVMADAG
ncbi:MAG TPA: CHASE2 domain-containing protein, partial [Candidatus Sulfopaludibacter sp.]|nr:CHASE2 domain-containing protein [Candidatus Sulfopaludibacter sp.]